MTEKLNGKYLAPEVEVIVLRSNMVLCQSGGIDNMGYGTPVDGDNNF